MGSELSYFALQMIHGGRIVERNIDELTGICKGALLDGCIDQTDAEGILKWLNDNPLCLDTWPASTLYDRLRDMLSDGILDEDEERELLALVCTIAHPGRDEELPLAALPINSPPPLITFPSRSFCLTGIFETGTREACAMEITGRGGIVQKGITKKLDYLVIGAVASEHWKHSTFGNKIAKAVEYRSNGAALSIISESHWRESLK